MKARFEAFGGVEMGGEGRGWNLFNLTCLVQFLEGKGREEEGSKNLHRLIYCFPPNWSFLEGREGVQLMLLLH